ncbi:MAG TPA: substrate-binding domain-containing protein [Candidatus Acidoferrales bacterium]|nr:substrate-binding domain-containing protein [Candidatus Acidoferrales bacterium]
MSQGIPNARQVHRGHDAGPQDLHAGGATFPGYAYNLASQPTGLASGTQAGPGAGSLFASAGTSGTIYYCLTGSGFGRKVFTDATPTNATAPCAALGQTATGMGAEVDAPDFVGSDVALASTEYPTYKTNREPSVGTNYGEPFEFPAIGGPIVYGYRTEDFKALKKAKLSVQLSEWTYCAIANGTVTDWNDAAITKDNGGVSITNGVSRPITFFYRSDGSGTSYIFQNHLATVCSSSWLPPYSKKPYQTAKRNAAWTLGTSQSWLGKTTGNFVGENGNPGVLAAVQAQSYGLGYVEGAYARAASEPSISQAWLQNSQGKFIDPTVALNVKTALSRVQLGDVTFGGGSDGLPLGTSRKSCIYYIDPSHFANPPEKDAYPIVGVSYFLMFGNSNGLHTADRLKLVNYMISPAANTVVSNLEYTALNKGLQKSIGQAANGTGPFAGHPCIH